MELVVIAAVCLVAGVIAGAFVRGMGSSVRRNQIEELSAILRTEVVSAQSLALQQNSEQFLQLAETRMRTESEKAEEQLKARGQEIDKSLEGVGNAIVRLREYVEATDKTRGESIASLTTVTTALGASTGKLTSILASGPTRGQWGERMAEDILRVAGFVEGVQYRKNTALEEGRRPDFTFLLPEARVLHMDVKFPLASYVKYLEGQTEDVRETELRNFLRDVRSRVKEVTTRDYIDPANGTLDYMLLFIPNEQVYGFIHERDPALLEGALEQHVVLCSPFTLFAVLAVIRQAMDNFHLAQQTNEILRTLGGFNQQWAKYKGAMNAVSTRLDRTQRAFAELVGTRTRVLDRQVEKVERLRLDAGLEPEVLPSSDDEAVFVDDGDSEGLHETSPEFR